MDLFCGKCRYDIRGLSSSTCPECGADLNVVGRVTAAHFRTVALIRGAVWSVVVLVAVGVAFGLYKLCEPLNVSERIRVNLSNPVSGTFQQLLVERGYSKCTSAFRLGKHGRDWEGRIVVTLNDGSMVRWTFESDGDGFVIDTPNTQAIRINEAGDLLKCLQSTNQSWNVSLKPDEVTYLFEMMQFVWEEVPEQDRRKQKQWYVYSSWRNESTQSVDCADIGPFNLKHYWNQGHIRGLFPGDPFELVVGTFWSLIWLAGLWRIWRLHRPMTQLI